MRRGVRRALSSVVKESEMQREETADDGPEEMRRRDLYGFTPREDQVVQLIVHQGLTYEQIAERLGIQARTVRGYAVNAFNKIGVNSREELLRWWYEEGPGSPEGRRREEE